MKRYEYVNLDADFDTIDSDIFVGNATEIRTLYKSFNRSAFKGTSNLYPVFFSTPLFNGDKTYGLEVCDNGHFSVIGENTLLSYFTNGLMIPVSDCGDCTPSIPVKGRVTIDE